MTSVASDRMEGKTCLITGGNAGIGRETAVALARKGATVVIVSRNLEKGETAIEEIKTRSRNDAVHMIQADLSSFASVHALAAEFKKTYSSLHVLINNAGGIFMPRAVTGDGLEMTFQVNHLSHFLLTHLLMDLLRASAPSRIVNVASEAHRGGTMHFNDLMLEKGYQGFKAYSQSKLANILFTYELARRLEGTGVTVNALHPGVVATGFGRNTHSFFRHLVKIGRFVMITEEEGAQTSIYVASSPTLGKISGKYFSRCREVSSIPESRDVAVARRLWDVSQRLTGLQAP